MWFKNLQLFRLPKHWSMTAEALEAALEPQQFVPCTSIQLLSQGWIPPANDGRLVYASNRQILLKLRTEKKLLPSSVINQVARERAAELAEQQGFRCGRKQMKEIKEQVADELLPRAFSLQADTGVWIDTVNGWLAIDAASAARAEEVIKLLVKAIDQLPLATLRTTLSPVGAMTNWLLSDEPPHGFTIDQELELRSSAHGNATVRYVRHSVEPDEVRRHITAGKQCTRVALTWRDKVSLVLTESLAVKRVAALDVLKEGNDTASAAEEERFESDFQLMAGELAQMLDDLLSALGGEQIAQAA
ncbi:MAG: recombination-dependent growth factor [Pseudomonadota bacterium]|jgi:recombination associated protein RdgC